MCNSQPLQSARDLETASYATRRIAIALPEAPHWLTIEMYWNTAMQQDNNWSIPFEACTKEILIAVC